MVVVMMVERRGRQWWKPGRVDKKQSEKSGRHPLPVMLSSNISLTSSAAIFYPTPSSEFWTLLSGPLTLSW